MSKSALITPPINVSTDTACEAVEDTMRGFPLPLYCATRTVPPVARATNRLTMNILSESTMLTALTAATPEELTMAVFSMLMSTIKAVSARMGT